jgi:transposase InsO family protein
MREWMTPEEIASCAFSCLPKSKRGIQQLIKRENWNTRKDLQGSPLARRRKTVGGGLEYHYSLLPDVVHARILKTISGETPPAPKMSLGTDRSVDWAYYDRLPTVRKEKTEKRLAILQRVNTLHHTNNLTKEDAVRLVAADEDSVSRATIFNWFKKVEGVNEKDWLPALVDRRGGSRREAECDPRAWGLLKADFLRLENPKFTACYRRLQKISKKENLTIPCENTLRRKMDSEIPAEVQILSRKGERALKALFPAQERDRSVFHALEAVNADGHKWDVRVNLKGQEVRPVMAAVQDLYSGKFLGWRFDTTENQDMIRLAFADMFRNYGIPDYAYLDNGRGFASKYLTGRQTTRFRFKIKHDEPSGILTKLGIKVHWTTPYSGQSKPIERAFRDFCEDIAKDPRFHGAYTGNSVANKPENYGSRLVEWDEFVAIVTEGIHEHNARVGRNTQACERRKSFDQAFDESYANSLIRRASSEQLRECLLAAESVTVNRVETSFKIEGNRYQNLKLAEHLGEKVMVRFDPDNLHNDVYVYRLDGRFICEAECIERTGFNDTQAARIFNRNRRGMIKATKERQRFLNEMSIDELAASLPQIEKHQAPEPDVIKLVGNGDPQINNNDIEEADNNAFFENLGTGLRVVNDD